MLSPTRILRAVTIGVLALSCHAAEFDPLAGPKPIFVFIETDPWLMVIGSDTPRLALYENGELMFTAKIDGRFAYRHQMLDAAGIEHFRQRLRPLEKLQKVKPWYNIAPNATDQPEAKFYIRIDGREITTRVYGLMAEGTRLPAWTTFPGGPRPDRLPNELLELHRFVTQYDDPTSPEWIPPCVEAMLWPYEYAPEESIHWPNDWPGLESDRSWKRGDMYHVILDGAELPRLEAFLGSRRQKGAVEVAGKKWSVEYRYTFPNEPLWQKAFRDAPTARTRTLGDRVADFWSTITDVSSVLVELWIPTAIVGLIVVVVGTVRLRAKPLPWTRALILLVPLLIPIVMTLIACWIDRSSSLEEAGTTGRIILGIAAGIIPLGGMMVFFSRGFRWFSLSVILLEIWITFCFLLVAISTLR